MPYKENLKKASVLKHELDGFRPLTPEAEKRIMQKFRLDWNYHSSHIEGNTLTYGETKALILFGQTAQAKPLKDHIEMSGHDEAVKYIEEIVRQERPLTENFIRDLHKMILKKPYEVDAITPEGKPTKKKIKIGAYKTTPNHVKTPTGEIFYFASPEETPAKMSDLMNWFKKNMDNQKLHPVLFATEFHYRFIRIHPFDDGNGRVARLLMNFILMQKGYPPSIIKTEDKENYFIALQQADAGHIEYFFNYVCEQVIHSLELMIKGARGESIEDEDDLDKEIELLKRQASAKSEIKIKKSRKVIQQIYTDSLKNLFEQIEKQLAKFDDLFFDKEHSYRVENPIETTKLKLPGRTLTYIEGQIFFNPNQPDKYGKIIGKSYSGKRPMGKIKYPNIYKLILDYFWKGYKNAGVNTFNTTCRIEIEMSEFMYTAKDNMQNKELLKKLYDETITQDEIKDVTKKLANNVLVNIKQNLESIKKKS